MPKPHVQRYTNTCRQQYYVVTLSLHNVAVDDNQSRRGVLKGVLGLTCVTCAASGTASGGPNHETASAQANEWEVLDVDGHPFSIRYRSGYEADAEQVREWGKFAYSSVQEAYSHELSTPITFDLYPAEEWGQPAGNMVYRENSHSAEMVTPSEYDGGYSNKAMFYRHGVTHEYVHAVQKDNLSFHTHANWMMDGFAEAIAVYYTDDEIYNTYHTNHGRAIQTREDIRRGYGFVLGINEYRYRGSMHLLKFMFEQYGSQAVGEIFEQDAQSIVEAIELRLGITPLDLEADWLAYAQREFGGDYSDQLARLGKTVTGTLSVDTGRSFDQGTVTVEKASYQESPYVIAVFDETMSRVGVSDVFDAGDDPENVDIELTTSLDQPHQLTIRLHHTADDGIGNPVTVEGRPLAKTLLYSTEEAAVKFATEPEPGSSVVNLTAFVANSYQTNDIIGIYAIDGDSTNARDRISNPHGTMEAGESRINLDLDLDESKSAVPLSDGQTITITLVDFENGDIIASSTSEVGSSTSNDQDTTTETDPATTTEPDRTTESDPTTTTNPDPTTETDPATTTEPSSTVQPSQTQQTTGAQTRSATRPRTTSTSTEEASATEEASTTSDGATPGLGLGSALMGLGATIKYLRGRSDD